MPKNRWSPLEVKQFAAKVFERYKQYPFDNLTSTAKHVMAHDWPAERRRHINCVSPTGDKAVYDEICKLYKEWSNRKANEETPKPPEVIQIEVPVTIEPAFFLRQQPLEVLVQEVLSRITQPLQLLSGMAESLQRLETRAQNHNPQGQNGLRVPAPSAVSVKPPRPCRLRIGVGGVMRDQYQHILEKCGDRADFHWLDTLRDATNVPPSLNEVVLCNLTRHAWYEVAKSTLGNEHVHFVNGGTSAAVQKILDLTSRQ